MGVITISLCRNSTPDSGDEDRTEDDERYNARL